jgi:UDP-2,3-diacylglucosamine pyrophosphatase LpxH
MKTYLASDMHIGLEDSNYPAIMDFFELVRHDGDELILLGDTLELWLNTITNIETLQPYKAAFDSLMKTVSVVPTTMVCGNHDFNLRKVIRNPNIRIEDRFTRGKYRFMHGWELDVMQLPASPLYGFILQCFPYLYQRFLYKPPAPDKYTLSLDPNDLIETIARKYADKEGYSYVMFGHTHQPMIEGKLINPGDMVEHSSYITITDGSAELWHLDEKEN